MLIAVVLIFPIAGRDRDKLEKSRRIELLKKNRCSRLQMSRADELDID